MKNEENMITDWLGQHGDPEAEKFVAKNLTIVEKVRYALDQKGWSKLDLANAMGKNASEVTKWLSGMHNLTLKSIIKMETALGTDLIHAEPTKECQYVFLGAIENQDQLANKAEDYQETRKSIEYPIAM